MADTIRIKRRTSGSPGAPTSLANAELAFNEVDGVLYYGKGTGGAGGSATTVIPIGGNGAFVPIAGGEITGNLTVDGTVTASSGLLVGDDLLNNTLLRINGQQGSPRAFVLQTVSKNRWRFTANSTSEGGGNSGSDFAIEAWNDAGTAAISTPIAITRSTGIITTSNKLILGAGPTGDMDAANKAYVDNAVQGLDAKASARVATTVNISLLGTQTIDGVSVAINDRVLVKDQSAPATNGIYIVQGGAWTRATDMDSWADVPSAYVWIENGTANGDSGWLCTSDAGGTINSTPITWVQFSGAAQINAGAGLTKSGNTLDVGGTANRITVNPDNIDIASNYVGQASITTLGTVSAGAWAASVIGVPYGGTGASSLTGYVRGAGTGPFTASATIPVSDVSGLGSMALQNANAVNITGGSIDNVVFDGGVF